MSFISSTNTLTLGSSDNTTINIGTTATNPTINIGVTGDDNPVLIRGLDPLITSATSLFARYRDSTAGFAQNTNCLYFLPFNTTTNILIQWGQIPDMDTTTYTFQLSYNSPPYLYITRFNQSSSGAASVINSVSSTNFQVDSVFGIDNKSTFNWLAIGLFDK